jgi:glycosyltransferase involved in cell wall biosynthesis
MGKRIRLGLIFSVDENWIGGTYYILNLISALASLPEERKPFITILSKNKTDFDAAKKTGYPYLVYQNPLDYKRNIGEAVINKLVKYFTKRDIIDKRISQKKIDVLFPANNDPCFNRIKNMLYWFPDFQHIIYPNFFKEGELDTRNAVIKEIANSSLPLLLSSQAAWRDWESLSLDTSCKVHVVPFAVTHPSIGDLDIGELLKEFKIEKDYFMVSNQFWKHKNHEVVLRAVQEVKKQGFLCQFIFTGKEDDYRNPGYFHSLELFIKENNLEGDVKMLGLIDRRKQLKLMKHAKAVIQPSLFEGWSTVVEDAKSLGKMVIASDIPVHREQLHSGGLFFDPHNENDLVEKIEEVLKGSNHFQQKEYEGAVKLFGESFMKIISDFKSSIGTTYNII